jgi:thiol-disulfide isomerase/thioredoxin
MPNKRSSFQLKKMKNVAFLLINFIFLFSISFSQNNNLPNEAEINVLEKLLPENSPAPDFKGKIFYKKSKEKIKNSAEFDKKLKNFDVNLKEKITILQFWEQNCKYSKLALAKLEKINKKYKNKKVQIFALNSKDLHKKENLLDFLNNYQNTELSFDAATNEFSEKIDKKYFKTFDIPILFIDKQVQDIYGVTAFPAVYIINKEGYIVTAMIGYFEEYENWMSEILDLMIKHNK